GAHREAAEAAREQPLDVREVSAAAGGGGGNVERIGRGHGPSVAGRQGLARDGGGLVHRDRMLGLGAAMTGANKGGWVGAAEGDGERAFRSGDFFKPESAPLRLGRGCDQGPNTWVS